jgi:hypothetical protein
VRCHDGRGAKGGDKMVLFGFWLMAGIALGMILMGFLAIGTYQRGYEEGYFRRKPWRGELSARRQATRNVYARETSLAPSLTPVSRLAEAPPVAVAATG